MTNTNNKTNVSAFHICLVALAIVINIIGGQLALALRLPIYLDSIGTIFVGATLGPVWGMLPNFLSGIIMGMTTDIYSLYFAPVGIILGFVTGLVCKKGLPKKWKTLLVALMITLPSTIVSASICAYLFGGITSSGSTILVQLLSHTPLGMTGACFVVQFITDYIDRVISLILAVEMYRLIPKNLMLKVESKYGKVYDR